MKINLSIILPAIFLVFIGLSMFYVIDFQIFKQQLVSFIVSIIAYIIFLNFNYKYFNYSSKYTYVLMISLLIVVSIVGTEVKGAVRWIDVFGINIQLSEIFKPFVILFFAHFLAKNEKKSFVKFLQILLLLLPIFLLIAKQPDLGNAIVYVFAVILMMFMYKFPVKYFVYLFSLVILLLPVFFNFLYDYQKSRILSFLNYSGDPSGSSYNLIQSMISVGSGGVMGKGLGEGTQSLLKFLPEKHTDFIFATISENLGFLGGTVVLVLYFILFFSIIRIAQKTKEELYRLVLFGYFFLFLTHFFFNVGMNVGIVPIVGITLPFVSYGGSSLLTNFIILGIISSISFDSKSGFSMEIR